MSSSEQYVPQSIDASLTSAMISDSLDVVGVRNNVMANHVVPLFEGARVLGRASTVHFEPSDEDSEHPYDDAIAYIDTLRPGNVAVIATGDNLSTAYWGELFSAAAIGRGALGAVTDGNIRDTEKIKGLKFPVWSAGRRPIDFRARMKIATMGGRVHVGGVAIDHGDLIVADDDGVVVIPRALEHEVLALARARASSESMVLDELLGGATLRHVWDTYRVL
jgi:regulator of RNase E activity RraA